MGLVPYGKKLRRMRWAGHVTCIGAMRNAYGICVEKPEERYCFEIVDGVRKIALKWILNKQDGVT